MTVKPARHSGTLWDSTIELLFERVTPTIEAAIS
jgi:hypothetical protein